MNNFWEGFFSILKIKPNKFRILSPEEAAEHDRKALEGDWKAVGNDMRKAMGLKEIE
ncbi:MAG: hypothetical protein P8J32_02800 [bacterium]|nr:hypothetical protein [bacterium]